MFGQNDAYTFVKVGSRMECDGDLCFYLMLNVHAVETNPKLLDDIETFFDKHYEDLF